MKILDLVFTANSNLFQSKLRTMLTIGAIFVGAMVLTLSLGFGKGATEYIDYQLKGIDYSNVIQVTPKIDISFGDIFPNQPKKYEEGKQLISQDTFKPLSTLDFEKISKIEGVESIKPQYEIEQKYIEIDRNKYSAPVSSIFDEVQIPLVAGSIKNLDDSSIVLGNGYLKALNISDPKDLIGKEVIIVQVNKDGESKDFKFKVSAVAASSILINVESFISENSANKIMEFKDKTIFENKEAFTYYVTTNSELTKEQVIEIKERLKVAGYSAQTFDEFSSQFNSLINGVQFGLMGFSFIVLFVSIFGIVNTLLMSVYERTREIGLMKALGMRNIKVFQLFAIESAIIGFWGSVSGIVAATALGSFLNSVLGESLSDSLAGFRIYSFPAPEVPYIILGIVFVALLAGTLPALKASKLDPINALKYE